ncbi:MAG: GguC family protein [Candidatus Poribacteria bacterium]|nr:GguC family protein [Candidatus Poribacteria bacterium]
MRLVQFHSPEKGRRIGYIDGQAVVDLTSISPEWTQIYHLFFEARRSGKTITAYVGDTAVYNADKMPYDQLLKARPGDANGWILPPLDHPEPAHCSISGTGLTHLGSMEARDQMHTIANQDETAKTDSQKIFEMGLEEGRPEPGARGVQPEWFYKGSGEILRGHNDFLDIPDFTADGGEEPEIVGCYVVDDDGIPCRLGFAIGNEWADHRMERVNYLWLAPSKMRVCAVGPELVTDETFTDVRGNCRIVRGEEEIYNSGELLTGEDHMSHTLANLEDHHFKYPQFRIPGDVHLHYFGTMKLSFPDRPTFQTGDGIEIRFAGMGAPLVNYVRQIPISDTPVTVEHG